MNIKKKRVNSPMLGFLALCILLLVLLVAFARTAGAQTLVDGTIRPRVDAPQAKPLTNASRNVVVHKNPGCTCCDKWATHLRENGFKVRVIETGDLQALKKEVGIPVGRGSCHTAQVGGMFVEGHVPADAIKAALVSRIKERGLVLPGMPGGSPGMEVPGGGKPYIVEWVDTRGATHPFRTYRP